MYACGLVGMLVAFLVLVWVGSMLQTPREDGGVVTSGFLDAIPGCVFWGWVFGVFTIGMTLLYFVVGD